jgi:hypothetical protein
MPGVVVSSSNGRRLFVWDPDIHQPAGLRLTRGLDLGGAFSADGRAVAGVSGGRAPGPLIAGRVHHGVAVMHDVPGARAGQVLGWTDRNHLVAERYNAHEDLVSVDVRTGRTREISRLDDAVDIAQDAVYGGSTALAVAPPHPWNRRVVMIWTLVLLVLIPLLGWIGTVAWREGGRERR